MHKIRIILGLAFILSIQPSFAHSMSSDSRACASIANACSNAGFTGAETGNKRFWQDCMRPIILGQSVQGITIDANTVKTCRADKIQELKKELNEYQKVS